MSADLIAVLPAVSATLEAFDRATALTDALSSAFAWSYRADGQLATSGQPNGNTTAYIYDAAGHLTDQATTAAGPTNRAVYAWAYNPAGQITSEATSITGDPTNGTRDYAYDPLGRLTAFTNDGGTTTNWRVRV